MTLVYDPTDELEIAVYKVFYKFIEQLDDQEPIYLLDSNFIAPSGTYTVVKLNSVTPVSSKTSWETHVDPDTQEQTTYNNFIGLANIYTYGSRALSRAQKIAFSTKDRNLRKALNYNGIGVVGTSDVRNASRAISGTEMEERAQFSIEFNFVQSLTIANTDGFIEHINSTGNLEDADEIITITPSASSPDAV